MSAAAVERLLARLYTDAALRRRFLAAPLQVAGEAGLGAEEARAVASIDAASLELAARSYERKRMSHAAAQGGGMLRRLLRL